MANLSALPDHVIDLIDAGLKGRQPVPAAEAVTITRSLPHGHVAAVHAMARQLGLPGLLGAHNAWDRPGAEVALLDRVTGQPLRDVAQALLLRYESVGVGIRPNGPSTDPLRIVYQSEVGLLEKELVEKARADIGLRQENAWHRLRHLRRRLPNR